VSHDTGQPLCYIRNMEQVEIPRELRWVAYLFLFNGVCALISIPVSFLEGHPTLDTGLLGLAAGPGLLRLSRGWYLWALFCTWLAIILLPIMGGMTLIAPHANLNILGFAGASIPSFVAMLGCAFWFTVAVWQLIVLAREDVARLFAPRAISRF